VSQFYFTTDSDCSPTFSRCTL